MNQLDQTAYDIINRPFLQLHFHEDHATHLTTPEAEWYYPELVSLPHIQWERSNIDYFVSPDNLTYYLLLNTQTSGAGGAVTRDATLVDISALDYLESASGDWVVLKLRYDLLQNIPKTVDIFSYLRQGVFTQLDCSHARNPILFGSELFSALGKNTLTLDLTKQNISATMISLEHTK